MGVDVSVILPCRNEEKTIGKCISKIKSVFKKKNINGEIIISDSSSDSSFKIAKKENVVLVKHNELGYGIAIMKGIEKSKGELLIIGDADGTYDFSEIPKLLEKKEYDLVIGSRIKGNIKKGAMPFLHRYIGNPILSSILNLFFKTKISDTHCGLRLIKKEAYDKLNLQTKGMEFASEMIIKAAKNNLTISEVPITYYPRIGESKLRSFSDGWRHLRFMLLFSPTHLYFLPGLLLLVLGFMLFAFNSYYSVIGAVSSILGFQIISIGFFARVFATHSGYETHDEFINLISKIITLERSIILGLLILISSILASKYNLLLSLTVLIISIQFIFSAFFISMMVVEKI